MYILFKSFSFIIPILYLLYIQYIFLQKDILTAASLIIFLGYHINSILQTKETTIK